jgi:BirA family transcriptional regulator, biotin operon repressor / biotin---[acetyl-CoA-carboxylase] ligase
MSDALPPELAGGLEATASRRGALGYPVYYFSETGSTNDVAAALAERHAAEGTLVVASAQSAGRGRLGRSWHSPPDAGLYASLIVRSAAAAPFLTLAGGVAVAEGITAATGLPVQIKWPNDIVVDDTARPSRRRKLAGILAEASSDPEGVVYVVLGFGINLRTAAYPPELAGRVTSIEAELGRPVDAGLVLGETLAALESRLRGLRHGEPGDLLDRWRELAPASRGAAVEFAGAAGQVQGLAEGIDETGALLVRVAGRIERVIGGEVIWK